MTCVSAVSESSSESIVHAADPARIAEVFREVLGHFGTGVVVVVTATEQDDQPVGMTVGSFTSISLDPPLVGFFAGVASTTLPRVVDAGAFCVNVLSEAQGALAAGFARSGTDKFRGVRWEPGAHGAPRFDGAHAWIECDLEASHTYGDHDLVVGAVRTLTVPTTTEPLLFHRARFHGLRAL